MKSFSNFCNSEPKNKETRKEESKNSQDKIQEAYDELKDLNSDELTQRLFSEVKKQKQNGSFDYNGLCDSVERMRPFISNETYQNMKNMLGKIK